MKTALIAHRGASRDAPENTWAAARLAWEQGADAIECDVRQTRDGHLVVIHDAGTRRCAGVNRQVARCTAAALGGLDVGAWKAARFRGERIPRLDEFLAAVPRDRRILVELKGGSECIDNYVRAVKRSGIRRESLVTIAFDLEAVAAARRRLRGSEAAWIIDAPGKERRPLAELIGLARAAGMDGLDFSARWPIDRALVRRLRRQGLKTWVWTVDDARLARQLLDAGVAGIATNRPGWLRMRLRRV